MTMWSHLSCVTPPSRSPPSSRLQTACMSPSQHTHTHTHSFLYLLLIIIIDTHPWTLHSGQITPIIFPCLALKMNMNTLARAQTHTHTHTQTHTQKHTHTHTHRYTHTHTHSQTHTHTHTHRQGLHSNEVERDCHDIAEIKFNSILFIERQNNTIVKKSALQITGPEK